MHLTKKHAFVRSTVSGLLVVLHDRKAWLWIVHCRLVSNLVEAVQCEKEA